MKRRKFIKDASLAAMGTYFVPYILPSGRLFAPTGTRLANHVVFVLFAGGVRHQESIEKTYLSAQGIPVSGNLMQNMLSGAAPSSNLVYNPWTPILSSPLSSMGTLFSELKYADGPTGHFNGHTAAITGNYTNSGLNLNINPEFPTVFEYYRKHTDPAKSAINCWWMSEGLGPYPSLNFSSHAEYGSLYGANYLRPATTFGSYGNQYMANGLQFQLDDVGKIDTMKNFMNANFDKEISDIPGIINTPQDRQTLKDFFNQTLQITNNNSIDKPLPTGAAQTEMTGDLINIMYAWQVMKNIQPELMVINTFNLDTCHSDFTGYLRFLHKADYGVGWLWDKIQNDPVLANDTIMICMPDHGRNQSPNNIYDANGLRAFDHTSDDNARRNFALIVGPPGVVVQNQVLGSFGNPVGENIDIVPTIAHILGYYNEIPSGMLPGNVLTQAFV